MPNGGKMVFMIFLFCEIVLSTPSGISVRFRNKYISFGRCATLGLMKYIKNGDSYDISNGILSFNDTTLIPHTDMRVKVV